MLIGLIGKKGSGKTEVAKYLCKDGYSSHNFKDGLITEMLMLFPHTLAEIATMYATIPTKLFETKPQVIRRMMQNYGTDVRRKDNKDYWTRIWADTYPEDKSNIVVDDVRFMNEASIIKELNGILIRVNVSGEKSSDNHKSEVEMDEIKYDDVITVERGDLIGLYNEIDKVIKKYE